MAYYMDNSTMESLPSSTVSPMINPDNGEDLTWTIFQVFHTMLTVVALGNNCFSLIVIYGVVARLTPPLQLLTSLAFSDMLAPWAVMTMYFPASACQEEIHSALLLTAHNSAALGLAVLALAHNIATFHPLQYDRIITQKRIWITINLVWIAAILTAHMHFLATLAHHDPNISFCVNVQNNMNMALVMAVTFCAALGLVAMCIYGRMLLHLRPLELAMSQGTPADQAHQAQSRKSTRSVVTGIILAAIHVFCWLPYLITKFVHAEDYANPSRSVLVANAVCQALVLVSCAADPVVYGLRMTNMQTGYHRLYQRTRGWCTVTWTRIAQHATTADNDHPATPLNPIESICWEEEPLISLIVLKVRFTVSFLMNTMNEKDPYFWTQWYPATL